MYAGHKRLVEKKSLFFPGKMPPCPARTVQPAHLPASSPSSASPGLPPRSGLPMPRRRTPAAAFQAFTRSMLTSLRHPWLRLSATPAPGARAAPRLSPSLVAQVFNLCLLPPQVDNLRLRSGIPLPPVAQVFNLCPSQARPSRKNVCSVPRPFTLTSPRSAKRKASPSRARVVGDTWIRDGSPCDSIRLARFTVSPQRS